MSGSSSVTVIVVGLGEIVIVSVVPIVLTIVTCAVKADEADAPAPPSTGTTDHVGLLPRASRPRRSRTANGAASVVNERVKRMRIAKSCLKSIFAMILR